MKKNTMLTVLGIAGLCLSLSALSGCQSSGIAGMTLPSGEYLNHPPQFFPDDPDFTLQNELAAQQASAARGAPGGPQALPRPVGQ
jgi:hypothetical protein